MQLERTILRLVFKVVGEAQVKSLVDLELVVEAYVVDVLGAVDVELVFVEPLAFIFAEQAPLRAFAQAEDVRLLALGGVLNVNLVTESEIPESENVLFQSSAEFTRIRKLVREPAL